MAENATAYQVWYKHTDHQNDDDRLADDTTAYALKADAQAEADRINAVWIDRRLAERNRNREARIAKSKATTEANEILKAGGSDYRFSEPPIPPEVTRQDVITELSKEEGWHYVGELNIISPSTPHPTQVSTCVHCGGEITLAPHERKWKDNSGNKPYLCLNSVILGHSPRDP